MKKLKSVFLIMFSLMIIFTMTACGKKSESADASKKDSDSADSSETEVSPGKDTSSGTSDTDEKITLSFSTSVYVEEPHQKAIDGLIAAYNKKNPNVTIEIYGAGYDGYWDNITTEILANNESDMIQVYPENISTYQAIRPEGTFLDLTPYIQGTGLEDKLVGQELCSVDNQVLAISNYAWGTTGIFYRKSLLKEAGVDPESIKTQEDFRNACKKFVKEGKHAMGVVSGTHAFTISEWNRLIARPVSGGLYFKNNESGPYTAENVNVNCPENVWAAKWWQDFILKDKAAKLVPDKKDSREMFWNNEVPFNMDGPWFVGMTRERDESLMDDIGIIPQFDIVYEGKNYKPNPTNYPLVTMISKNCKHPDEAWEFLKWMASDEAQAIIAECGMIPSNIDYSTSEEYIQNHSLEYQIVDFMKNNYTDLIADPNIPQLGELSQIMLDVGQAMFSEQAADVQTEMNKAQKAIEEVMSR